MMAAAVSVWVRTKRSPAGAGCSHHVQVRAAAGQAEHDPGTRRGQGG